MEISDHYHQQLQKIEKFAPPAIDALFEDYGEIMLSLDQEQVVKAVIARLRLNAETLNINNKPLATDCVEHAFISLLDENRLTVKSFGFSILAQEAIRELRAKFSVAQ
ncbi:MAG: hypothetical protein WCC97_08475 [Candidatus Acidiferrales bacterium]